MNSCGVHSRYTALWIRTRIIHTPSCLWASGARPWPVFRTWQWWRRGSQISAKGRIRVIFLTPWIRWYELYSDQFKRKKALIRSYRNPRQEASARHSQNETLGFQPRWSALPSYPKLPWYNTLILINPIPLKCPTLVSKTTVIKIALIWSIQHLWSAPPSYPKLPW